MLGRMEPPGASSPYLARAEQHLLVVLAHKRLGADLDARDVEVLVEHVQEVVRRNPHNARRCRKHTKVYPRTRISAGQLSAALAVYRPNRMVGARGADAYRWRPRRRRRRRPWWWFSCTPLEAAWRTESRKDDTGEGEEAAKAEQQQQHRPVARWSRVGAAVDRCKVRLWRDLQDDCASGGGGSLCALRNAGGRETTGGVRSVHAARG